MRKVYKFRLYPTKPQLKKLGRTLELCRYVYNKTLETRKKAWEEDGRTLSKYSLNNLLPEWKKEDPELKEVFSQTLQEVQERVDLAFKYFFRRLKNGDNPGYPRFKGKGWYDSFCYPQMGFKVHDNSVYLSKIGEVYMVKHREIEGEIKRICVRRKNNKWYACITADVRPAEISNSLAVGVDVGLESFATLSTGEKIANPRFFREDEKALAKAQRKLSKTEKGTPRRDRAMKVVSRIHERIGNRRYDFVHQLSRKLVNRFGLIAFEDLSIKKMVKNHRLAKSVSDAAWRMLINATRYKAESAGTKVVLVNPANTSKMCSRCGQIVEKTLDERVHRCPCCGLVMDRDENAAINILRLGLQSVAYKA
ncbi:transposase, IS605 OrfB family, central region [Methanocella conradii HZ254]|uniref:Transposase, IS605 OrfB family, central region n=2 Tax=Methanocella TaxID=570266 RepID=H8I7F8_METCZ|nr:RNA-guided endonuclease TnpB family protein [Methanocella conradii]AFD00824.1 transposase, IS605 OrfB family, central region [Methanocella conradii HZ254]